jgi:hypothetical protein
MMTYKDGRPAEAHYVAAQRRVVEATPPLGSLIVGARKAYGLILIKRHVIVPIRFVYDLGTIQGVDGRPTGKTVDPALPVVAIGKFYAQMDLTLATRGVKLVYVARSQHCLLVADTTGV